MSMLSPPHLLELYFVKFSVLVTPSSLKTVLDLRTNFLPKSARKLNLHVSRNSLVWFVSNVVYTAYSVPFYE